MNCTVCTEDNIKSIACPKCSYLACETCVKRFLLAEKNSEPVCMNCKIGWSLDFIREIGKGFEDDFRTHRVQLILEMEKSLLPETQQYVELKNRLTQVRSDIKKLSEEQNVISTIVWKKHLILLNTRGQLLLEMERLDPNKKVKKEVSSKVKFNLKCPNPKCNGYISETKCGLCLTQVCQECMEIIDEEHKCNPEVLENIKLLRKDTKNCPKCHTAIYKISGCDQMYCTYCHTAFSWRTGLIESKRIHNPHYYEYKRSQNIPLPREPEDICEDGLVNYDLLLTKLDILYGKPHKNKLFSFIHRSIGHIRELLYDRYRDRFIPDENFDLRVRFLENNLTLERFHTILKRRDKRKQKNQTVRLILEMYCDTANTLLKNILTYQDKSMLQIFFTEMEALRNYTNSILEETKKRFKTKTFIIDCEYDLI